MKFRRLFPFLFVLLLINPFLYPNKSLAGWAYSFVVWDGFIYVVNDEVVEEIVEEIGHVTRYSDREGTYSGNFSNTYKKGTSYFSIKGISTDEAIAVQNEEGKYIKAVRDGEYAGNKKDLTALIVGFLVFSLLAILGIYFVDKRKSKTKGISA